MEPIKSVRRLFEIIELFDQERRPLSANEIGRRLRYPLTSAHALLKSMHALGYADFDPENWSYLPSRRLPNLLEWVSDLLEQEPDLLRFVAALSNETSETINVSRLYVDQAKIIYGLESTHAVGVSVKVGTFMPATQALTGIALLSTLSEAELDEYWKRLKSRDPRQMRELDDQIVAKMFEEIKSHGAAMGCDLFIDGIGAVCAPVRLSSSDECLVVGVVGPSERIRQHERAHRQALKRLASKFEIKTVFRLKTPASAD